MRTDPRVACGNEKELLGWAIVHDLLAHPFMALTGYSRVSLRFHDWTSHRAWPRDERYYVPLRQTVLSDRFGPLHVISTLPFMFRVSLSSIEHTYGVRARDVSDAVEQAEAWFDRLAEDIPEIDRSKRC